MQEEIEKEKQMQEEKSEMGQEVNENVTQQTLSTALDLMLSGDNRMPAAKRMQAKMALIATMSLHIMTLDKALRDCNVRQAAQAKELALGLGALGERLAKLEGEVAYFATKGIHCTDK